MDDDSHDDADNELDELEFQEKHGACKRKRKEAGKGRKSKTVGRTHTPSYACAATTKAEKQKARQVCARCLKAGRPSNGVRHKGKMCPFALGPAPEDSAFKFQVSRITTPEGEGTYNPMELAGLYNNLKKKTADSRYRRQ